MQTQPDNLATAEAQPKTSPFYLYIFNHAGTLYHIGGWNADISVTGMPSPKGSDPQLFTRGQVKHVLNEQGANTIALSATVSIALTDTQESAELKAYFISSPAKKVIIQIVRMNPGVLDANNPTVAWADGYTVFIGQLSVPTFTDYGLTVTCQSLFKNLKSKVPRYTYQKTCQHVLYGSLAGPGGCNNIADGGGSNPKEKWAITAAITSLDRINKAMTVNLTLPITIAGTEFTDAMIYEGGFFTDSAGSITTIMAAEQVTGATIMYLSWWNPIVKVGDTVTIYRGCRRVAGPGGCQDFGNVKNFGATSYIPIGNIGVDGLR